MNKYLITKANRQDLVSWLRQGNVQRVSDALLNLAPIKPLTDNVIEDLGFAMLPYTTQEEFMDFARAIERQLLGELE